MSTFWALKLGDGEAFLLQTFHENKPRTVLVDSGFSRPAGSADHPLVTEVLAAVPDLQNIDIAICTHEDTDHAGGFTDFADYWCRDGRKLGQYWLPARWGTALPHLLTNKVRFLNRVVEEAGRIASKAEDCETAFSLSELVEGVVSSESYSEVAQKVKLVVPEGFGDDKVNAEKLASKLGVSQDVYKELKDKLSEGSKFGSEVISRTTKFVDRIWYPHEPGDAAAFQMIARMVLKNVALLNEIVESAIRNDVLIRWFDFSLFDKTRVPSGGISGFLEPVCAVELSAPPSATEQDVIYALTRENAESLVFHRVPDAREIPGVLFLADSRLARRRRDFPQPKNLGGEGYVVTAPHHGSSNNDHAYAVLSAWGVRVEWCIRNGGHHKIIPSKFMSYRNRACAYCEASSFENQRVRVDGFFEKWSSSLTDSSPCSCS